MRLASVLWTMMAVLLWIIAGGCILAMDELGFQLSWCW